MRKPKNVETAFIKYEIGEQLGQGGCGTVYKAFDESRLKYAIKFLTNTSTEKLKRFKNEYLFCFKNTHENIIKVLDYGLHLGEYPFFVMPLYYFSLKNKMGELSPKQAYDIFLGILDGVEAAHLKGVIHRDIKPENILISPEFIPVIADFGIAHFIEEELHTFIETKPGDRMANFQYAAPEQKERGADVDLRADIFALGLLLNELFTGKVPHGAGYATIESVYPDYAFLDPIVEKMIMQNPANRFASIDEIKKELIALKKQHISRQKLSMLNKTVIDKTEIEDPLIDDPIKIIGVDWKDGTLTIQLNHHVNSDWIWALNNMGGYQSLLGKAPEVFNFNGSIASIDSESRSVQDIINYFNEWLPRANQRYAEKIRKDIEIKEYRERAALQKEKEAEQKRLDLLNNLKF